MEFDLVIVGAGPAGLSFARSLAGSGLRLALVDPHEAASLSDPPFDGREIALTHHSVYLLRRLGLWERMPADAIHVLRDAQVLDGDSQPGMQLRHGESDRPQLGFLVANQLIRRTAFAAIEGQEALSLFCGQRVIEIHADRERAQVRLSDGQILSTRLVVAADSRFSETRRAMGIPADMHDFGKTMMVCRMQHEQPHHQVAWEWFDYGQTLALLPLVEHQSSVVVTLSHAGIERLMAMPEADFGAAMEVRFHQRLGRMRLTSTRHAYPLVGVYPRHFVAERFAVIGDAAVGMHPVTAHGFNFGLLGQDLLAQAIRGAQAAHADIAGAQLLARYERELRRATRPLYLATRAIALLYTDDRGPARVLRRAGLSFGARLQPLRRAMIQGLTQEGDSHAATYPLLAALRSLRR
jgi:ubiquinone biosynthesis UbiH/UbiF/VisC/COQ6 family hydroxylase